MALTIWPAYEAISEYLVSKLTETIIFENGPPYKGNDTHLYINIMPTENENITVDGLCISNNLLQILVLSPAGKGSKTPKLLADKVLRLFPFDHQLTTTGGDLIRFIKAPNPRPMYSDETWAKIPILFPFQFTFKQ